RRIQLLCSARLPSLNRHPEPALQITHLQAGQLHRCPMCLVLLVDGRAAVHTWQSGERECVLQTSHKDTNSEYKVFSTARNDQYVRYAVQGGSDSRAAPGE